VTHSHIADIAYQNKAAVYAILFKAAAETLLTIAADPKHLGARIGMTAVLHTWGSALTHHPHVHFIVPGGGTSPTARLSLPISPATPTASPSQTAASIGSTAATPMVRAIEPRPIARTRTATASATIPIEHRATEHRGPRFPPLRLVRRLPAEFAAHACIRQASDNPSQGADIRAFPFSSQGSCA
jgi:hypothetical protein